MAWNAKLRAQAFPSFLAMLDCIGRVEIWAQGLARHARAFLCISMGARVCVVPNHAGGEASRLSLNCCF